MKISKPLFTLLVLLASNTLFAMQQPQKQANKQAYDKKAQYDDAYTTRTDGGGYCPGNRPSSPDSPTTPQEETPSSDNSLFFYCPAGN